MPQAREDDERVIGARERRNEGGDQSRLLQTNSFFCFDSNCGGFLQSRNRGSLQILLQVTGNVAKRNTVAKPLPGEGYGTSCLRSGALGLFPNHQPRQRRVLNERIPGTRSRLFMN